MSSSDAMFEALSVCFQYVNEQAAHVKIDCVSRSKSLISLVVGWLSTTGVLCTKIKRLWGIRMIFQYFCKLFVPKSEGPPLRSQIVEFIIIIRSILKINTTNTFPHGDPILLHNQSSSVICSVAINSNVTIKKTLSAISRDALPVTAP